MSLFSRRSMMVVAGCALALPLAGGAANAAFDLGDAVPDEVSVSAEGSVSPHGGSGAVHSSVGNGAVQAGKNGARVKVCAAETRSCAKARVSGLPHSVQAQVPDVGEPHGSVANERSDAGVSARGSAGHDGQQVSGRASLTTEGGSLEVDSSAGGASASLGADGGSVDVHGSR